jgi:hypothetical protein
MDKRYQVFVSSTYEDLQEERREVMQALLELDCIPAGMELFPAADESQWSVIKRVIEDCDYYILIVGGRYGSCGPDGTSYTEMEYRHALSIDKPIMAFLHKEPGDIPANKCEATDEGKKRLDAFKALVQGRMVKFWTNTGELGGVVSRSMLKLIKAKPAVGWVRADQLADKDASEIVKLRRRIDELESEVTQLSTSAPKGTEDLAQGEDAYKLKYTYLEFSGDKKKVMSVAISPTWNAIFAVIAPHMMNEASEVDLSEHLSSFFGRQIANHLPCDDPGLQFGHFSLDDEDFQTIKVQFKGLGLITQSVKKRKPDDEDTYWKLTPYGEQVMIRLRAIKRQVET